MRGDKRMISSLNILKTQESSDLDYKDGKIQTQSYL